MMRVACALVLCTKGTTANITIAFNASTTPFSLSLSAECGGVHTETQTHTQRQCSHDIVKCVCVWQALREDEDGGGTFYILPEKQRAQKSPTARASDDAASQRPSCRPTANSFEIPCARLIGIPYSTPNNKTPRTTTHFILCGIIHLLHNAPPLREQTHTHTLTQ